MTTTARDLAALTYSVVDKNDPDDHKKWVAHVKQADTGLLVETTSLLTSNADKRDAKVKALREAIISEIERKNAEHLVNTMHKLDESADRLSKYSLVLAVIGIALALIQVLQAFGILGKLAK